MSRPLFCTLQLKQLCPVQLLLFTVSCRRVKPHLIPIFLPHPTLIVLWFCHFHQKIWNSRLSLIIIHFLSKLLRALFPWSRFHWSPLIISSHFWHFQSPICCHWPFAYSTSTMNSLPFLHLSVAVDCNSFPHVLHIFFIIVWIWVLIFLFICI